MQVFLNLPLLLANDQQHAQQEHRYYVPGQTNAKRRLSIAFTIRNHKIRVISARDYLNWSQAQRVAFSNLKPSVKTISLRPSETMLNELKVPANRMEVYPINRS